MYMSLPSIHSNTINSLCVCFFCMYMYVCVCVVHPLSTKVCRQVLATDVCLDLENARLDLPIWLLKNGVLSQATSIELNSNNRLTELSNVHSNYAVQREALDKVAAPVLPPPPPPPLDSLLCALSACLTHLTVPLSPAIDARHGGHSQAHARP